MSDSGAPEYPNVLVSTEGAPPGCANIHDTATGQTVMATATEAGICNAIKNLGGK